MKLTPEQIALIDAWLPDLDIPIPDAGLEVGHEAWQTKTLIASLCRQLDDRFQRHGLQVSREALVADIVERIQKATSRQRPS
jgi:hypothetical protein